MKIVFIIDQVYMHGGIERVLSIKANYFSSIKTNEIHIFTTEQKKIKPCYEFNDSIIFTDLEINYNRLKSYFHPINLIKLPKHISKLKSRLKKINPDVVVVCSHSTDTYFIPFINKKIPKVKEFHYSKFIEEKKRKNPNFIKKLYFKFTDYVETKYDKLVILNRDEANYYKSNNFKIIPNPLTFYPESVSNLSYKTIIAAGRIAEVKGYDILIDIWEFIYKKHSDWQLHIYGDGDPNYCKTLQEKVNTKNLQNSIVLKGATDNIQSKMLSSSIFVMTSHNECFPLVLLEAQACGLPIVSFDCPYGPRNIISKENGLLVTLYNQEEFVENLTQLINNEDLRKNLGKSARKNASKYNLENVMSLWQKMFNDLIAHKRN